MGLKWRVQNGPYGQCNGWNQGTDNVEPAGTVSPKRLPGALSTFNRYADPQELWIYPKRLFRAKRRDYITRTARLCVRVKP